MGHSLEVKSEEFLPFSPSLPLLLHPTPYLQESASIIGRVNQLKPTFNLCSKVGRR